MAGNSILLALETLLVGAGLEWETGTLDELRRWGRLLNRLRAQPAAEQRQVTLEALRLRGLPEAIVLLAVDVVLTSVVAPPCA